jgi:hypothetical protein
MVHLLWGGRAACRQGAPVNGRTAPRTIGLLALLVVMAAAGWYVFVYLTRWEWNRAIVSGVIFLAAEVALLGTLVLERLARVLRRVETIDRPDDRVVSILQTHRPEPLHPFAWLQGTQTTNVFVPVLLGAGLVLSGLAWIVERVARITAVPTMERGLAHRLTRLQPPSDGLLGESTVDPFRPR